MTEVERARECWLAIALRDPRRESVTAIIAAAIRAAVEDERERVRRKRDAVRRWANNEPSPGGQE